MRAFLDKWVSEQTKLSNVGGNKGTRNRRFRHCFNVNLVDVYVIDPYFIIDNGEH